MDEGKRFTEWIRIELAKQKKTWGDLAKSMGLSAAAISAKVTGKVRWTLPDMEHACALVESMYTIGGKR